MDRIKYYFGVLFIAFLLLSACGGGDGDAPASNNPSPNNPPALPPSGGSINDSNWHLPPTNFVSAKMSPVIVFPRPDAETNTWARNRKTYPGLQYRIPIVVQGGAYPFKYDLVAAPAGMTIGKFWDQNDYGIVRWDNPLSGSYDIQVDVTDQDGTTVSVSWHLDVNTSKTLFLSPTGNNANPGTLAQPKLSNSSWHLNNDNDTTYDGYHIYYRGGTYALDGDPATGNNIRLHSGKPMVLLAYPGETPIFDMSTGKFVGFNALASHLGPQDLFVSGIRFENGDQTDANSHYFWLTGNSVKRVTLFENYFYNLGPGSAGNDNPSVCFVSNTTNRKSYFAYVGNVYEDLLASGNGVSAFDHYYTDYTVFENNEFRNNQGRFGAWQKSHNDLATFRRNKGKFNTAGVEGLMNFSTYDQIPDATAEFCWNYIEANNPSGFAGAIVWVDQEVKGKGHAFVYRNTFVGRVHARTSGGGVYTRMAENNVIVTDYSTPLNNFVDANNLIGSPTDGIIDATGNLQGTYQSSLGTHGWQIQ